VSKLGYGDRVAVGVSSVHGLDGCLPADHLHVSGAPGALGPDPRTGFDAVRFYRYWVGELGKRGF
jgi:hypothetical protein